MGFKKQLKYFDAYPKTHEDFRVRTFSGATISIVSFTFILFLFISEFAFYLKTEVHPQLSVDTTRGEQLRINIDIVFPRLPCAFVRVDAMDVAGQAQFDVEHSLLKKRLSQDGTPVAAQPEKENTLGKAKEDPKANGGKPRCGSCYGAEQNEGQCCNTCEEVRNAYRIKGWSFTNPESIEQCAEEHWKDKIMAQKNEGCHIFGHLMVNKVAGNFHFVPAQGFNIFAAENEFDVSHKINSLSFGEPYPGKENPLDAIEKEAPVNNDGGSAIYQYFVKVVPTTYRPLSGPTIVTNQFSATEHFRALPKTDHTQRGHQHNLPGIFFLYDLSPIMVEYTERRKNLSHFLTGVCAIVGGVFTVAGILNSLLHTTIIAFQKNVLGKAS